MCVSRADEHAVLPSVLTLTDVTASWGPFSWSLASNGFGTSYMALNCERGWRDGC